MTSLRRRQIAPPAEGSQVLVEYEPKELASLAGHFGVLAASLCPWPRRRGMERRR